MADELYPKLRPIQVGTEYQNGQSLLVLRDPLGLSNDAIALPVYIGPLLNLCDGTRDIPTLKTAMELRTGTVLTIQNLNRLFAALDEALLLENKHFTEAYQIALAKFRAAPSRSPTMVDISCRENPEQLERMFQEYLNMLAPENKKASKTQKLRGLVSPHIDFLRGGITYAKVWYRAIDILRSVDIVLILGTSHLYSDNLISLTKQNYSTPWGILPTAQDLVDALAAELGDGVFTDELNHRHEHSVEAAATWLHFFTKDNDHECNVVPMICRSMAHFIEDNKSPQDDEEIARFVDAIKKATHNKCTFIVAAGDLAHVGPAFGDVYAIGPEQKSTLNMLDNELMIRITQGDAEGMFHFVMRERDRRRICGLSPIYLALRILGKTSGEITGYAHCPADSESKSVVSICGIVFS